MVEPTEEEVDLLNSVGVQYPTGDYNQNVINFVRDTGYKAAFGIDNINNIGFPKFEIPRVGIYSSKRSYLEAKMSGLYHKPLNRLAID